MSQHSSERPDQRDQPRIAPEEHPAEPAPAASAAGVPLGRIILGLARPYRIG